MARDGHLVVDIADDGVGGAESDGSGLRGLTDRSLRSAVRRDESPPRSGTRVHFELPCV
jgi:signal transduction histidine kinase